jgi:hypothetical protein
MNRTVRNVIASLTLTTTAVVVATAGTAAAQESSMFLGKGVVQEALGLRNADLQALASDLKFRTVSEETSEYSWSCVNANNERQQIRTQVTTVKTEAVLTALTRDKRNNVTGFILIDDPAQEEVTTVTKGPKRYSCPEGPWTLDETIAFAAALAEDVSPVAAVLQVSTDNGEAWTELP